jgi:prepilin-type N-terminal cleavage/methylation domain-containing protein
MLKSNKYKAFSLIELSIVILIIGILVAGVTQSSRLIRQLRLQSVRNLTSSSPVSSITGLIAWYESTSEKSFNEAEASDQLTLSNWYDINPLSTEKRNASQTVEVNKPIYSIDNSTSLPVVRFVNQDFFNLPDGTIPFGNSAYTIFFVSKTESFCVCGVLGSGNYGNTNQTNAFRYDGLAGLFYNYWFGVDLAIYGSSVLNKMQIYSFRYNLSSREAFVDGVLRGTTPSSNRQSSSSNNTIGKTYISEYMLGSIAEVIIYERALNTEERQSIEKYLGKKWGILVQ